MMGFSTRERRHLLSRRFTVALCAGSLALQLGCYSYAPVQSSPPVQADRMSITINDKGRELLRERVSPLVDRIDGRFVSMDSTNLVLRVTRVVDLRSGATNWMGEQITIPREAILGYQDKPYSRSRTFAFVGALVLGLIVVITSISLAVSGNGLPDPTPDPGGSGQS